MKRIGFLALLLFSGAIACVVTGIIAAPLNQAHADAADSAGTSQLAVNSGLDRVADIDRSDENGNPLSLSSAYDLTWHTIDGGGGTSTGGSYELAGTIGQPDAGTMTGGDYELAGGFWTGGADVEPECPIVGDLNCDQTVDSQDLFILLAAWGECQACRDCPADLTGDCSVDAEDLFILLANWG